MANTDPEVSSMADSDSDSEQDDFSIEEDESGEDPTYDILEESLSNLSLKKSKSRISGSVKMDSDCKIELDPVDQKSYENVEKIIQAADIEKLKIDQCKVYLRKHGLRLTGNKNILIDRIREHVGIVDGGGEKQYPVSSFVVNCKGDACTGDIVMFEQNVYEMYSIASRSATGPPCGTRTVAGRIVKESYGAAKQQHTFTIEVLWSTGMKPLPPLHPLLIKGRNLYRLKTLRQVWSDEEERRKMLLEKHSRGSVARFNRETRILEKEMKKTCKGKREPTVISSKNEGHTNQPLVNPTKQNFSQYQTVQANSVVTEVCQQNKSLKCSYFQGGRGILRSPFETQKNNFSEQQRNGYSSQGWNHQANRVGSYPNFIVPPLAHNTMHHLAGNEHPSHVQSYQKENTPQPMAMKSFSPVPRSPPRWEGGPVPMRQQQQQKRWRICRYYNQGRCSFGDKCKFLHENRYKESA